MNACSGKGVCRNDGTCNCNAGFYGRSCGASCSAGLARLICSGRGTCQGGACVCKTGMTGLISGYSGNVCQDVVYNRTGTRAFSTAVAPHALVAAEVWVAAVAPLCIAGAYVLAVLMRTVRNGE